MPIQKKRLTKAEIAEGMKAVPIETIILGAQSKQGIKLTKKQREFAEQVVATGNKTEAYRRSHNHTGKNTTASRNAQTLVKSTNVQTYILALEAQKEVEEYLLPPRLRAMAIHKLSNMALNDDLPPAQQLKALELVGKMTEVSLFTERRELVHTLDASSLKDKLMEAVQLAIANSKSLQMKTKRSAEQLLKEISLEDEVTDVAYIDAEKDIGIEKEDAIDSDLKATSISAVATGSISPISDPPPSATTPFLTEPDAGHLHSISHKELPSKSVTLTPVTVTNSLESETCEKLSINPNDLIPIGKGEGVSKMVWTEKESPIETPPSTFLNQKG